MIPTFVLTAALAVGAYEPVPAPAVPIEVHKVPGPAFLIPCKVQAADLITHVQLWVSADRGGKWELYEEITPDKSAFTFVAKKPGEYWFAPRVKKKDGTLLPTDATDLVATQRVAVATGSDGSEPLAKPTAADALNELDEELTRVELELIRKEIKKLSEMKELTPEAEAKFDRLRDRLWKIRGTSRPATVGPAVVSRPVQLDVPSVRPTGSDGVHIPPQSLPTAPAVTPMPVPVRPVAPPPRVPER